MSDETTEKDLVPLSTEPDPSTQAPQPTWAQKAVRRAALPTALGVAGAAGGAFVGGLAGVAPAVPLALAGEVGGNMAGEWVNQQFGIGGAEKGDTTSTLVAGAGPIAGRAIAGGISLLPGFSAGVQEWALKNLGVNGEKVAASMITTGAKASQLWKRVDALSDSMLPTATRQALEEAETELGKRVPSLRPAGVQSVISDLRAWLNPESALGGLDPSRIRGISSGVAEHSMPLSESGLSLPGRTPVVKVSDFNMNRQGLGERLQNLIAAGGEGAGLAKKLYGAMWDDLETWATSAPSGMSQLFQDAVRATKQKEAADFIGKLFQKAVVRPQGLQEVNLRSVMEGIDHNKDLISRWLSPSEIADLQSSIAAFARKAPVTPGASEGGMGTHYASRAIVGASLGSLIGWLTGHNPIASGIGGVAAGTAGSKAIGTLLTSPWGRAFVREYAASPGAMGMNGVYNAMAQTARGAVAPNLQMNTGQYDIGPPLKVIDEGGEAGR